MEDSEIPEVEKYYQAYRYKEWYPSLRYIQYLAEKRNRAITQALEEFPETTDIICVDSYYLQQSKGLGQLIRDYDKIGGGCILGGAVWGIVRARFSHLFKREITWFDKWGVSELRFMPYGWNPQKDSVAFRIRVPLPGLYRVHSVAGVHIFPRSVWEKGARCGVTEDLHVCEHGTLCEASGLPVYIDFNAKFWREKIYSIPHCIRNSIHAGRIRRLWT